MTRLTITIKGGNWLCENKLASGFESLLQRLEITHCKTVCDESGEHQIFTADVMDELLPLFYAAATVLAKRLTPPSATFQIEKTQTWFAIIPK